MYVCMYVCMVITNSRVWVNRVRLPSLVVICRRSRLIIRSLETGSAVSSRASLLVLHTQAECGAYLRYFSRFPRRRPFIYTVNRHGVIPSLSCHSIAYDSVYCREVAGGGSVVFKVVRVAGAAFSGTE